MPLESWKYGNPENFMDRQIAQSKNEERKKKKKSAQSRFTEEELKMIPAGWLKSRNTVKE